VAALVSSSTSTRPNASATRALLACGIAAGPLYVLVGALEMLTRPGFDPLRHDLSLMANGDFGWLHSGLLIVSGLLVIASAVGMRSALGTGLASTWAPRLIALYGIGLVGAGIFAADPAYGFPPGTPADAHDVSFHGLMHLVSGSVGFVGFIAACFVLARRFSRFNQRAWALFSRVTGVVFAAAFVGIASGSQQGGVITTMVILAFTAAVVLGWTWLSAVQLHLSQEVAP
jgi:Protein of unknown function (DUF998)